MARGLVFLILLVLFFGLAGPTLALDKVKLGSSVKLDAGFYMPISAAQERGFWKENGLDVEWVPFAGGAPHFRAVAAGAISVGLATAVDPVLAAERGVPVVMVAELYGRPFRMWVRTDSPYRHPQDLKGAKIGVTALGGAAHTYARIILAAHGIEKDVRFVGAGGIPEMLAGIRVGAIDGFALSLGAVIGLKLERIIRDIASTADYLPKPWFEGVVFAQKDFSRGKPEVVRRMLKATVQSVDFIRKNPGWAFDKIKSFQGLPEEAARLAYEDTKFSITGQLDRKAVENLRRVFIEYGLLTEKAPAVDELFTNEYLP